MLAQAGGGGRRFQALAVLAALLAGCSTLPPEPAPRVARMLHSMPEASLPLPAPSAARTLGEYRREFARRLQAANPDQVFEGPPPNPVRAVIVMRAEVDPLGDARLRLVRAPWHSMELEAVARATLRRAEPFAPPSRELMNGRRRVAFDETWLFDYEGRFRLRSLSQAQAELPPEDEEEGEAP